MIFPQYPNSLQMAAWRRKKKPQNAEIRCKTLHNATSPPLNKLVKWNQAIFPIPKISISLHLPHDDISSIRRKKQQFAAKRCNSSQFAAIHRKTPQNAEKRRKTLQNAAKRRKTPQNATKRRKMAVLYKTPQFAAIHHKTQQNAA